MRNLSFFVLICIFFVACNSNEVVGDTKNFSDGWQQDEPVVFNFPELDSLKTYNLFLTVRNSNDYPFNNLFLIASIKFPHGKTVVDTLEYKMAAPDGKWLGEGIGTVKDSKLWYKENVRFAEDGNYSLSLRQAVRNNGEVDGVKDLQGITDVGYTIEEASK